MRLKVARSAADVLSAMSRRAGRGEGGVIGGRAMLALVPDAARVLAADRDVVLVSGTNGKTTTSAMLAAAWRTLGAVTTNDNGANIPAGITTALANSDSERVVLETDEAWVPWTVSMTAPRMAVLLNLSRDQLDRHHEVEKLSRVWRPAVIDLDVVVANADDPHVVWAAQAARRQVWVAAGQRWNQDAVVCPRCGGRCTYAETGWSCTCGLQRPRPDWWVEGDELVSRSGQRVRSKLALPGAANLSNAAMAVAAATELGVEPQAAANAMTDISTVAGRYAVFERDGRRARLLLAKNPAGWLEMLSMIQDSPGPAAIVFNSEGVDGLDPSWLYDVPFEQLRGRQVVVTGRRATDMLVRLRFARVDGAQAYPKLTEALAALPEGPVDVLANYSAFQQARAELSNGQ